MITLMSSLNDLTIKNRSMKFNYQQAGKIFIKSWLAPLCASAARI